MHVLSFENNRIHSDTFSALEFIITPAQLEYLQYRALFSKVASKGVLYYQGNLILRFEFLFWAIWRIVARAGQKRAE